MGVLRQGLPGMESSGLWKEHSDSWGTMCSLERGEARLETSGEAGFMVQERDDDGFSQEIEQRGRQLQFCPPTMCWALYLTLFIHPLPS